MAYVYLWTFYGCHHDLVKRFGIYVFQMTPDMFRLSKSCPFLIQDLSFGWYQQKQVLPTRKEHLSVSRVLVGFVLLNLYFSLYCLIDHYLSFCHFFVGHCIICPSIYGYWLLLWYLLTFLVNSEIKYIIYYHSIKAKINLPRE
jgi:hypothetical protein